MSIMKKKIKIYSALLIAVLVLVLVYGFVPKFENAQYREYDDEKLEFVTPPSEFDVSSHKVHTMSYTLTVKPKSLTRGDIPDHKILLSTANGQRYKITMKEVNAEIPITTTGLKWLWNDPGGKLSLCFHVVNIIVILWIMYLAFRIIYNIRRGEIFVSRVAKSLEVTGFLLSFLYLLQLCSSYICTQYFINHIKLADYYIVYKYDCNTLLIITGLALIVISQVILMGKDLKDDQELTI